MKNKFTLMKTEQSEGIKLKKFAGLGPMKFLEYFIWYQKVKFLKKV